MMIGFCFTMLGLVVGSRIFYYLQQKVFSIGTVKIFQIAWTFFMLLSFAFLYNQLTYLWILQFALLVLPCFVLIVHEKQRRAQFQRQILPLLDSILAQMIAGQTLKAALEIEYSFSPAVKFQIRELVSAIQFNSRASAFKDELMARTFVVFSDICKSQHRGIEKIRAFRDHIRTVERFRRKSGQVLAQIRAQLLVLGVLYAALLVGVLKFTTSSGLKTVILTSLTLFFIGSALTFAIPRTFRWKI